jgi:hypothetical protein
MAIVLGLAFAVAAWARADALGGSSGPTFANAALTDDTKQLAQDQAKAFFPDGPGEAAACTRGEPRRWYEPGHAGIRRPHFLTVSDQRFVEAVLLDDGANLVVAQWGCEYYGVSLRITWPATPSAAAADLRHWYATAGEWLRRLAASKPATPLHLEEAARILTQEARAPRPTAPGEPLTVLGGAIPETVTLATGRSLPDGKGSAVELTLLIGPL